MDVPGKRRGNVNGHGGLDSGKSESGLREGSESLSVCGSVESEESLESSEISRCVEKCIESPVCEVGM